MLTPETLTRHELVGLPARVADAGSADAVGIAGRVVSETMKTLVLDTDVECRGFDASGRSGEKRVPKAGTVFEFAVFQTQGDAASPRTATGGDGLSPQKRDAREASPRTDEAAADRKAAGSASELGPDTAGVRPGQSGPPTDTPRSGTVASQEKRGGDAASTNASGKQSDPRTDTPRGECEGVVYVTVDGAQLLSRPATRTERAR